MPRTSLASLSTTHQRPTSRVSGKLAPPSCLTEQQAAVWQRITAAMPADWFSAEHAALLTQFARHVARCDGIEEAIANLPVLDPAYERLARLARAESAKVAMLARAMRLTHQSRWQPRSAANHAQPQPGGIGALIQERRYADK
jgi:hypothetical protein